MENVRQILARNLRRTRHEGGISQEDLADMADVDRTYVSGIERGVRNPSIEVVARLAAAMKTTAAKLLSK